MQQAGQGGFEFEAVSVTGDGMLLLAGSLGPAPGAGPVGAAFAVVERRSLAEREFPASLDGGPAGGTAVRCTIPLAALAAPEDELLDLFFLLRGPSGTVRTRVAWQPEGLNWLPYPTKFGNLSFKRKGA
ncbi:hypothetical protein ACFQ36_17700 [Arthrobacter sp. GCM10027362]|uniref:hypothetical protein n=1 Tax=Arthrobacter sp. GCM10027362 TaxID=3273379 RepID=UPI00363D4483